MSGSLSYTVAAKPGQARRRVGLAGRRAENPSGAIVPDRP